MRAILQRVSEARVTVDGETVGAIGRGALVLLGVGHHDDLVVARSFAARIVGLRVFDDEQGRMNRSIAEVGGEMLVVSQFTLWADCGMVTGPSFTSETRIVAPKRPRAVRTPSRSTSSANAR